MRGYMGGPPPHQGPPMHMAPPDMRGPHDMRGAPILGEPRGPMMDQRGPPMDSRAPIPPGRDPRAVETRGPVAGQRVPVAAGMQGAPTHAMPPNAPPSARPGPAPEVSSQDHEKYGPVETTECEELELISITIELGHTKMVTHGKHCDSSSTLESFELQAALIMQVLQLTPEQIAMLPPEQRQSILILKEQIQKTAGAP